MDRDHTETKIVLIDWHAFVRSYEDDGDIILEFVIDHFYPNVGYRKFVTRLIRGINRIDIHQIRKSLTSAISIIEVGNTLVFEDSDFGDEYFRYGGDYKTSFEPYSEKDFKRLIGNLSNQLEELADLNRELRNSRSRTVSFIDKSVDRIEKRLSFNSDEKSKTILDILTRVKTVLVNTED